LHLKPFNGWVVNSKEKKKRKKANFLARHSPLIYGALLRAGSPVLFCRFSLPFLPESHEYSFFFAYVAETSFSFILLFFKNNSKIRKVCWTNKINLPRF